MMPYELAGGAGGVRIQPVILTAHGGLRNETLPDHLPGAFIHQDIRHEGHTAGWTDALGMGIVHATAHSASHILLVEDDAEPVPGFWEAAHRAAAARPTEVISLFLAASLYQELDLRAEGHWVRVWAARWRFTVAMLFPLHWAERFHGWWITHQNWMSLTRQAQLYGDTLLAEYCLRPDQERYIWCTIPCLVEHGGAEETTLGPPCVGSGPEHQHRLSASAAAGRRAYRLPHAGEDVAAIRWDAP